MEPFLIGVVLGLIFGVFIGAKVAPDKTTNLIRKIKDVSGNLDIDQVQQNKEPKMGLFKRIFKRKNK